MIYDLNYDGAYNIIRDSPTPGPAISVTWENGSTAPHHQCHSCPGKTFFVFEQLQGNSLHNSMPPTAMTSPATHPSSCCPRTAAPVPADVVGSPALGPVGVGSPALGPVGAGSSKKGSRLVVGVGLESVVERVVRVVEDEERVVVGVDDRLEAVALPLPPPPPPLLPPPVPHLPLVRQVSPASQ